MLRGGCGRVKIPLKRVQCEWAIAPSTKLGVPVLFRETAFTHLPLTARASRQN